jgi:hypothetical protein
MEQPTEACEPASFGVRQEHVLDVSYRKAGKMDSESFASMLDPVHADLINIIRDYLLEGTQSTMNIKAELCKLNVYGTHLIFVHYCIPFNSQSERAFANISCAQTHKFC